MTTKKKILVAPIFWGLGHASRCVPLIRKLIEHNFEVVIGSDGQALNLLKMEFPDLEVVSLPSYNIKYSRYGFLFKLTLILQLFRISLVISKERKLAKQLVKTHQLEGIISDGRLGMRNSKVPSIYITHQVTLKTGSTSFISTALHQYFIRKFDECWIPDASNRIANFSGKMGHPIKPVKNIKMRYIGILSRMKHRRIPKTTDILAILSGPEPQRTLLEKKILKELEGINKKIILVQGVVEEVQSRRQLGNIEVVNYMLSDELEETINSSKTVITRSGYSSIMDLAQLEAKAFLIPTPGQYEQLYLAKRLHHRALAPYSKQEDFSVNLLNRLSVYKGLTMPVAEPNWEELFSIFRN